MKLLFTAPVYVSKQAHLDFLEETLDSINTSHEYYIYLPINRLVPELKQNFDDLMLKKYSGKVAYIDNPEGNNVSAAWNMGLRYGLDNNFDYFFVINLDIIFHKDAIDTLVAFAQEKPQAVVWTGQEWSDRRTFSSLTLVRNGDDRLKVTCYGQEHDWERFDEHPHFSCFMMNERSIRLLKEYEKNLAEPQPGFFDTGFNRAYFEDQDFHQRILMAGFDAYKCNEAVFFHYGSRTIKSDEQLEQENVHTYELNRKYFKEKWGYDSHGKVPTNNERLKMAHLYPFNKEPVKE